MLRTKQDLNKFVSSFNALDSFYHRYNVCSDKVMYVDNSYGEFIPFFNVKPHKEILYCNILHGNIFREGLLKSEILHSKVHEFDLEDNKLTDIRCSILFTNCSNDRLLDKMMDHVEL